ncbi:MAG: hypothetical protein GF331_11905 [Chitinivibrionales bacterium]|nr:hypothetical protein [Chitinivibrionales bacterium]
MASAGIKVRQPLERVTVVAPRGQQAPVPRLDELIRRELNVKAVEAASDDAGLHTWRVAPRYRALGKVYGRLVPRIAEAVDALPAQEAVDAVNRGTAITLQVDGASLTLEPGYLEIKQQPRDDLAVASEGDLTVALSVAISPSLRRECYARDFVHTVQSLRRDMGLEIADRIGLTVQAPDELFAALVEHVEYIRREPLAVSLERTSRLAETRVTIGGHCVVVGVERTMS